MKLSRTAIYALQATLQLARSDGHAPIPCSRLAAEGEMPERFLLQILRNLVMHGILESTRGVDGGYRLDRKTDDISLLELIEAADGPLGSPLPTLEALPPEYRSRLEGIVTDVTEVTRRELQSIKLTHLLEGRDGHINKTHRHEAAPPSHTPLAARETT